jgi:hypothetical protein
MGNFAWAQEKQKQESILERLIKLEKELQQTKQELQQVKQEKQALENRIANLETSKEELAANKIVLDNGGIPTARLYTDSVSTNGGVLDLIDRASKNVKIHLSANPYNTSSYFNNGNVGIGTSTPQATLHVIGQIKTNDLLFEKDGTTLWRMFEDETGLFLQNVKTSKVYAFVLQEVQK